MRITIDTEAALLHVAEGGAAGTHPLYSVEAFRILSRQWMTLGWDLGHWATFSWMGRQLLQFPDDVLRLAEMLWRLRPNVLVETGTYDGGSALLFAGFCRVISVERDLRPGVREALQRAAGGPVLPIEGDSAALATAHAVARHIHPGERVCVFLDSDHSASHVAAELANYAGLVTPGCYLIVADSIIPELARTPRGNAAWTHDHPGAAVDRFLANHPEFVRERPNPLFGDAGFDFTELGYFAATWLLRSSMP
ncbi:MAG TPA: CmcI family methyltransferase [Candidatus Sulfopaludibacter sp.]|nr:CmcI family methyltransferase [Candidatus Sulfopaludibacter sp.]